MEVPYLAYSSTLKLEETCSSEMFIDYQWAALCYIPEDRILPASLWWISVLNINA
jgi:hypothetical protein